MFVYDQRNTEDGLQSIKMTKITILWVSTGSLLFAFESEYEIQMHKIIISAYFFSCVFRSSGDRNGVPRSSTRRNCSAGNTHHIIIINILLSTTGAYINDVSLVEIIYKVIVVTKILRKQVIYKLSGPRFNNSLPPTISLLVSCRLKMF